MKRSFKINNTKFNIVNRNTNNMEINNNNQKYDLMVFNTFYNAWKRVSSCMTLYEGREIAENYMENLLIVL